MKISVLGPTKLAMSGGKKLARGQNIQLVHSQFLDEHKYVFHSVKIVNYDVGN